MHMDSGRAQTEVSEQGHSLHNLLHMRIDNVCTPTQLSTQVHTVCSFLRIDTNISCEQNWASQTGHT